MNRLPLKAETFQDNILEVEYFKSGECFLTRDKEDPSKTIRMEVPLWLRVLIEELENDAARKAVKEERQRITKVLGLH